MVKDDERPRLGFETAEAALELVAVGHLRRGVVDGRGIDRIQDHVEPLAPEPPRLVDASVDEQSVEPGLEAVGAAKRGQVTPGTD